MAKRHKLRDDKLRASIGIYEGLMEDFGEIADIVIGNESIHDLDDRLSRSLPMLLSEFHFSPENVTLAESLIKRIKLLEKKTLRLREFVEANNKKAVYLYRNT